MNDTRSPAGTRPETTIDAIRLADLAGQVAAIDKALAVIEFNLDGTIISANQNFLRVMGYSLAEIVGKHHRVFVAPAERSSELYRLFWEKLARGEYDANRYKRITSDGREVWIQASYNPILLDGKPYKVVKYATDVTDQVQAATQNARLKNALDKASSSIMLADDGYNIIYANDAALKLFGEAQADFRREIPALDAARIIGSNIDIFHRNPAHQRQMLDALRSTMVSDIRVAGRAMRVAASPVFDSGGKRLGTVVEWFDRTQEVRAEEQVSMIIRKALEGDMMERIPMEGKTGSLATLAGGINQLLDNNAGMMRQIRQIATSVRQGAEEISQGNFNLSQRTENQSASLEETASSMEQMTSTVKQNADNAAQASKLATAARDQAEVGGTVVGKAVTAMSEIHSASKKIADILSVIDSIAFQTNLLALNAAVEAARAGEQGRGFAVVATEVRSLAGRSATAAKEIKALIEDSALKVKDGSKLVTQSGQMLEQIVLAVKKVSDIVGEIAVASHEQSVGIEQVNRAVMQMDEGTQQNAALAEQATAASRSMADQASQLSELMAGFRIGEFETDLAPVPANKTTSRHLAAVQGPHGRRPQTRVR